MQCFALRLLSDFTLMYQHCVGVLLKRDTDLATKEVGEQGTPGWELGELGGWEASVVYPILFLLPLVAILCASAAYEW